jgi:GT2 family glycosyltransferase/glycosyltransferase involved in cell wall biosynthesis
MKRKRRSKSGKESVKQWSSEPERRTTRITELEAKNKELRDQIERLRYELEEATATADHFANSYFWVIVTKYRELMNRYVPKGTRRRAVWEWMFRHATRSMTRRKQTENFREVDEKKPFGQWVKTTRSLIASNPRHLAPLRSRSVDIIIPVFNGLQSLQECIDSIRKHTQPPYRIVIVNDGSTDPSITNYLSDLENDHVRVLSNKRNLGFVESANLGFDFSKEDVVLLNSDTVVTVGWLEKMYKCAYSSDAIGTVTPLSNNATICSIPQFPEANRIPQGFTTDSFADLVKSVSEQDYPPIPTAVGFCVYIKRSLLEEVGHFDLTFSPGYGEENDLCMRALDADFLSALDDATFVYHQGEASFSTKADLLRKSHHQILLNKYPKYDAIVDEFIRTNPLREIHSRINEAILRGYELSLPKIAYVMHFPPQSTQSGGTGKHCRLLYRHIDGYVKYVIYPNENNLAIEEYTPIGKREFSYPSGERKTALISDEKTEEAFSRVLDECRPGIIHFQHLLGMPLSLIKIASEHSAKIVITLHDGYFLCPDFRLLEMGEKYCDGCTDLARCDLCLSARYDLKPGFQQEWRKTCRAMLELSDRIIAPSEYERDLCARVLSFDRKRISVIEHAIPSGHQTSIDTPRDIKTLRVGFVGHVEEKTKGRDLILKLLQGNTSLNREWHFFGEGSDIRGHLRDSSIKPRGKLFFHGYYKEGDLPSNLTEAAITVVVIPSIYGESYSYALTEVWRAGIPVIAPDLGAIGERVRKNGGGWLYPLGSDPSSILKILEDISGNPNEYKSKLREIASAKEQSFSEHISTYKALYTALIGDVVKPDLSSYPRFLDLRKPRLGQRDF